jgi:hypothetical protein
LDLKGFYLLFRATRTKQGRKIERPSASSGGQDLKIVRECEPLSLATFVGVKAVADERAGRYTQHCGLVFVVLSIVL